jgi:hypothetical protein
MQARLRRQLCGNWLQKDVPQGHEAWNGEGVQLWNTAVLEV